MYILIIHKMLLWRHHCFLYYIIILMDAHEFDVYIGIVMAIQRVKHRHSTLTQHTLYVHYVQPAVLQ